MSAKASGVYEPSPVVDMHEAVSAWFLGPQAENFDILSELFQHVLDGQKQARLSYHPEDGEFITSAIKESKVFLANKQKLYDELSNLSGLLNKYSIPFYSPRYAGHMSFETSMPAILGYISTILFNPNNVAFEASPITTQLEIDVGTQLCDMLGYNTVQTDDEPVAWGHIACDGTVANLESIWAARNLKYYPLSLRDAMAPGEGLAFIAEDFKVATVDQPGEMKLFASLTTWELLNLGVSDILAIPTRLQSEFEITDAYLNEVLSPFLIQTTGRDVLEKKWGIVNSPQYLITNTKHYSWPKGAAVVGIGSENMVDVPIDINARVNLDLLEQALEDRLAKQQAVYAIVAIIGSTEEGAVDDLDGMVAIRQRLQAKGMSFVLHADAAWGGYFATMIREKPVFHVPGFPSNRDEEDEDMEADRDFVPSVTLRPSTVKQFEALQYADSITIDPHKSGYIPYPAGGLCYRDGRMRYLLTWTAPYINTGVSDGESIGTYGIEGSKPGAAAAAVYLHHTVVGLHKDGHGGLLGEVSFTCRRISAHWAAMSTSDDAWLVVPLNMLQHEDDPKALEQEKELIRTRILGKTNEEVVADKEAMEELCALGSDLNINAFSCNFKIDGKVNEDVEEANYLNNLVFQQLSVTSMEETPSDTPLFITSTTFAYADYGACVDHYKERLGLETASQQDLFVLRNVCMSPFQTAGDFVQKLADIFQQTLEAQLPYVIQRNTVSPQTHTFTIQGTDTLFLVYRPMFHWANSRYQLIIRAEINDSAAIEQYQSARATYPDQVYTVQNQAAMVLDDLIAAGGFTATITGSGLNLQNVAVSNMTVIKENRLNSKYRDVAYPALGTPFYLYGTTSQQHIDHMLLIAPNAQLSADQVTLQLDQALTDEQLSKGLILFIDRPERAMQPFGTTNEPTFFAPNKQFRVSIVADPNDAVANGPGLLNFSVIPESVAKGTVTLGASVYVDADRVNQDTFTLTKGVDRVNKAINVSKGAGRVNQATPKAAEPSHGVHNYTSNKISAAHRAGWNEVVRSHLGPLALTQKAK